VTRFAGKQQTLWAYPDGYITRLDEAHEQDDAAAGAVDMVSWAQTRAMWFQQHEAIKAPFWLEVEFHRSSATDLTVIFVPDDVQTYPELALGATHVIQMGFSGSNFLTLPLVLPFTLVSRYTKRIPWHIINQPRFREGQILVHSSRGQIGLRKLKMAAWLDTPKLT
jgi:hypothetical protein